MYIGKWREKDLRNYWRTVWSCSEDRRFKGKIIKLEMIKIGKVGGVKKPQK